MSIRIKLLLFAGLSTLFCGLCAALLVYNTIQVHKQVDFFLPATSYLNGIAQTQTGLSRQMKEVLDYILSGDPTDIGEFRQENQTIDQGFELWFRAIDTQQSLGVEGEEKDLGHLRMIQHHHQVWAHNMEEVFHLAEAGRRANALELFGNYSQLLEQKLFPAFTEAVDDGINEVEEAYQGLLATARPFPWLRSNSSSHLRNIRATIDEVLAGHRLSETSNRQYVALMDYIATSGPDALSRYQRLRGQSELAIQDHIRAENFKKGLADYSDHSSVLVDLNQKLAQLGDQAIRLKHDQQTEAAVALLSNDFEKAMSGIFLPELERLIGNRSVDLLRMVNSRNSLGVIGIGLFLALLLLFVLRSSYRAISALSLLQTAMDDVAHGDFSGQVNLERSDEFGALAATFNKMMAEVKNSHSELARLNEGLENEIAKRTGQLEGLNRELQTFNSMVSHDLRNPLTVILGLSQLLQEKMENAGNREEAELLGRIVISSMTMTSMLEALHQLGAMTDKSLELETVDLSQMVRRQVLECQTRDPQRSLVSEITPGIQMQGDAALLLVAISNLVGNAWKFTSRQKEARLTFGQMTKGNETVCFLSDNGVGFEAEKAADIFAPFHRLHDRDDFPGTGLGLATVAKVFSLHGLRVWAESRPGQGTTIYFTCRPALRSEKPALMAC